MLPYFPMNVYGRRIATEVVHGDFLRSLFTMTIKHCVRSLCAATVYSQLTRCLTTFYHANVYRHRIATVVVHGDILRSSFTMAVICRKAASTTVVNGYREQLKYTMSNGVCRAKYTVAVLLR